MRPTATMLALALVLTACGGTSVFELSVGDCFDDPESLEQVGTLDTIDCAEPHDNEIYALRDYSGPGDAWPGEAAVEEAAFDVCLGEFEAFVGVDYSVSILDIAALWPSEESWADGDREIVCAVYHLEGEKLTGSARGSGL